MYPHTRNCYAIIVHYADDHITDQAAQALLKGESVPRAIVVIDHAIVPYQTTIDDSRMTLIRPRENTGYAAGVNIGLGALLSYGAQADDVVIIMNDDVIVRPDSVAKLSDWWKQNPNESLAGVAMHEGNKIISGFGYVNLLTGRTELAQTTTQHSAASLYTMPYIHGAFIVAPYGLLMQLKGLPDTYFLYWEDVLLSRRAQKMGVPLKIISEVEVEHRQSPSLASSNQRLYYLVRNGALFLENETPLFWRIAWWVANRLRLAYHTLVTRNKIVRQALLDAVRGLNGTMTT